MERVKLGNCESLEDAIRHVKQERKGTRDLIIPTPEKFQVEVEGKTKTGYGLQINGNLVPFSLDGVNSLCKWLKMDFHYFSKFPRKQEFIEHVQALLPKEMREHRGALVRMGTQGEVRGVLPGDYTILDDEQALNLVGEIAHQTLRKLKGVVVGSSQWNGSIYRLVFGDSAFERDEIYPCVNVLNSEIGGRLSVQFGTLRILCMNGSIDQTKVGTVLNWGHRGSFDNHVTKIGMALRVAGERVGPMLDSLKVAGKKYLDHPGEEVSRLLRAGWIGPAFHDSAKSILANQIHGGERFGGKSSVTKYGVFNALTEAAKGYRPRERARYEAVAHDYLVLPTK